MRGLSQWDNVLSMGVALGLSFNTVNVFLSKVGNFVVGGRVSLCALLALNSAL